MRTVARISAVAVLFFVALACRYEDGSWRPVAGADFPYWKTACVTAGMSQADVQTILGRPLRQERGTEENTTWVYEQTRERVSTMRILWLIPVPSRHRDAVSVRVSFANSRVTRVDTKNVDSGCDHH